MEPMETSMEKTSRATATGSRPSGTRLLRPSVMARMPTISSAVPITCGAGRRLSATGTSTPAGGTRGWHPPGPRSRWRGRGTRRGTWRRWRRSPGGRRRRGSRCCRTGWRLRGRASARVPVTPRCGAQAGPGPRQHACPVHTLSPQRRGARGLLHTIVQGVDSSGSDERSQGLHGHENGKFPQRELPQQAHAEGESRVQVSPCNRAGKRSWELGA